MAVAFSVFTSDPNLLACELRRLSEQVALVNGDRQNAVGVGHYGSDEVLLQRYRFDGPPREVWTLMPRRCLVFSTRSLRCLASQSSTRDASMSVARENPQPSNSRSQRRVTKATCWELTSLLLRDSRNACKSSAIERLCCDCGASRKPCEPMPLHAPVWLRAAWSGSCP